MRCCILLLPPARIPIPPYGYFNLPIQTMKAGALGTHNTLGVAWRKR